MKWILIVLILTATVIFAVYGKTFERTFKLKRDHKPPGESKIKKFLKKVVKLQAIPTIPPIPTLLPKKAIVDPLNEDFDPCKMVNLCQNGGLCVRESSSFYCDCPSNFYGKTCQFFASQTFCENHKCQNNGTCYSVDRAETVVNPDIIAVLKNNPGGGLKDLTVKINYQCWCKRGYYGSFCEYSESMRHCSDESCSGHGYVFPNETLTPSSECTCHCENNYSGKRCETVSPCRDLDCTNGGSCGINGDQEAECSCPAKIELIDGVKVTGNFCQFVEIPDAVIADAEACVPCRGGFTKWVDCLDGRGVDESELQVLWKDCTLNDPECHSKLAKDVDCFNDGVCNVAVDHLPIERLKKELFLVPHCTCREGHEGAFCEAKSSNPCDVSDEEKQSGMFKCLHGTCSFNPYQGIRCICDVGFNGVRCDVVDPCHPDPCDGSLCVPVGVDTDEPKHVCICQMDQDVDSGSLKCETPHHAICKTDSGDAVCSNGGHCYPCALDSESLNLCTDSETRRGFRCVCPAGYLEPFCAAHVDACSHHQCLNGGRCVLKNGSTADYSCHCKLGYTGNFCEKSPGICISQGFAVCIHGKCRVSDTSHRGFSCDCEDQFYGFNCQFEKNSTVFDKIDEYYFVSYPAVLAVVLMPLVLIALVVKRKQAEIDAYNGDVERLGGGMRADATGETTEEGLVDLDEGGGHLEEPKQERGESGDQWGKVVGEVRESAEKLKELKDKIKKSRSKSKEPSKEDNDKMSSKESPGRRNRKKSKHSRQDRKKRGSRVNQKVSRKPKKKFTRK